MCDIFSGTLAVSLELKRRGFAVASNDINFFSSVYARAFLDAVDVPEIDASMLIPPAQLVECRRHATALFFRLPKPPPLEHRPQ